MQIAERNPPSLFSRGDQAVGVAWLLLPPVVGVGFLMIVVLRLAVALPWPQPGPPASAAVVIAIEVTGRGAVMPHGVAVPWDALRSSFHAERDALRLSGVSAAAATVIVRAADDLPTGRVQEVLEAGQTAGFQQFLLKKAEGGGGKAEGSDTFPRPKTQDPRPKTQGPRLPIKIRLRAAADGSLASIRLNRRPLADLDELRAALRAILLSDGPPALGGSGPQVELDCDYNLRYDAILQAIAAISGDRTEDGARLVDRLKFAPRRPP